MRPVPNARAGRGWELLIAILAALAAGGAGGYLIALRAGTPGGSGAESPAARVERVTALGRLRPAGGVVPVYGPPGDRIAKMYDVKVGDAVTKDVTKIAELASSEERGQQVKVAETQLKEARKALAAAQRAGEEKVRAAEAELNQAAANEESDLAAIDARLAFLKVQLDAANAGVARLKDLLAKKVDVAAEVREKAEVLAAQAKAEFEATNAARAKTATSYAQSKKAAQAHIEAAKAELAEATARAPIESSEQQLALAEQLRDRTILKAPASGTVLQVTGRTGQPTGVEPILQIADLSAMTAVAEVYESDVGRVSEWVRKGPVKAEVKNPALPRPLTGVVRSEQDVSRMIARNQVFAMGPREDADRRVVEVVVHLDPDPAAERFVGLQVTVTLEPGK